MQGSANEKRDTLAGGMIVGNGAIWAPDESFQPSQTSAVEGRDHGAPDRKRRPKLRQLDAKDVDAVFAEDPGAINSLRDVQVHRCFTSYGAYILSMPNLSRVLTVAWFPDTTFSAFSSSSWSASFKYFFYAFSLQSWRVLVMGLQRLSEKDMARRVPVRGPVVALLFVRALNDRRGTCRHRVDAPPL